jgi:uncharacterized protein YndB with AHSA1/START domain
MKDTAKAEESVVIECDLPDPPEKVWRALTERELLAQWIMPNDMKPEVGARFSFRPAQEEGGRAEVECEVLEAEPNRTLRWRQRERDDSDAALAPVESVVSFELEAIPGGGTHLRVVHDEFSAEAIRAVARSSEPEACATVIQLKPRRVGATSRRRKTTAITSALTQFRRAA